MVHFPIRRSSTARVWNGQIKRTSRSGRLQESVEIKLPRPRALTIKRTPEFVTYVDHIWHLIEDDVRTAVIHEHV